MVQIDLLVAYSLSSGLALAAGEPLAAEADRWVNKYSFATLGWLTLLLGPQVLYLLWQYPCWETMFVAGGHEAVPSWLVAGYPIALGVLGMLGFFVTARLFAAGRVRLAALQVAWAGAGAVLVATVGWDGAAWRRTIYPGTCADWADGTTFPVLDFLSSPVARDLLWLQTLAVVPYAALLLWWLKARGGAR